MRTVAKTGRLMERFERNIRASWRRRRGGLGFHDLDGVAVAEVEAAARHDALALRKAGDDLDLVAGDRPGRHGPLSRGLALEHVEDGLLLREVPRENRGARGGQDVGALAGDELSLDEESGAERPRRVRNLDEDLHRSTGHVGGGVHEAHASLERPAGHGIGRERERLAHPDVGEPRRRDGDREVEVPVVDDAEHRVVRAHVLDEVAGVHGAGGHDSVQGRTQDRLREPGLGNIPLGARGAHGRLRRVGGRAGLVDLLLRRETRLLQLPGPLAFARGARGRHLGLEERRTGGGGHRLGLARVEPEEDVTLPHGRPFGDQHLGDDAAVFGLHLGLPLRLERADDGDRLPKRSDGSERRLDGHLLRSGRGAAASLARAARENGGAERRGSEDPGDLHRTGSFRGRRAERGDVIARTPGHDRAVTKFSCGRGPASDSPASVVASRREAWRIAEIVST